jgi:hypothetical protein
MLGSESVTWRGRPRHFALIAAATTIAAAALPAAASAKLIEPLTVSSHLIVAPGHKGSTHLKCPPRAVALNAAASSGLEDIDLVPRPTARGWNVRFSAGSSRIDTQVVLRCVRFDLPSAVTGVTLAVETQIEPVPEVAPNTTQKLSIGCSHGFVATGWGLDRTGDDNGLAIAAAVPTQNGWSFTVENSGDTAAGGTLYTRCLERKQHADSGQRHSFGTRIAKSSVSGASATRSCRSSEFSVSTGVSLPVSDDIFLTGTGPVGPHDGQWHFAKASGAGPVKTSLVCLSTTTHF